MWGVVLRFGLFVQLQKLKTHTLISAEKSYPFLSIFLQNSIFQETSKSMFDATSKQIDPYLRIFKNDHGCGFFIKNRPNGVAHRHILIVMTPPILLYLVPGTNQLPLRHFKQFIITRLLREYCTPDQFCDCLCIFLKNYNTLVASKIYFL